MQGTGLVFHLGDFIKSSINENLGFRIVTFNSTIKTVITVTETPFDSFCIIFNDDTTEKIYGKKALFYDKTDINFVNFINSFVSFKVKYTIETVTLNI